MDNRQNLIITAQLPGHKNFSRGIFETPKYIAGIDPSLGLIAITSSVCMVTENSPAHIAMKILMDDMQTNIPQFTSDLDDSKKSSMNVNCLQESLDNINEYLYSQVGILFESTSAVATQLSAFQYLNGYLSYILGAGIKCLLLRNNELKELSNVSSHLSGALGEKPLFESRAEEIKLNDGDILVIASAGDINTIEEDFIRLTLSRFPENLDTAIRQINTRASRSGMEDVPGIIFCCIDQGSNPKRGWLS